MSIFPRRSTTFLAALLSLSGCRPRQPPAPPVAPTPRPFHQDSVPEPGQRPPAIRVAQRAALLALISWRGSAEQSGDDPEGKMPGLLLAWVRGLGLEAELEPEERTLLETPIGKAGEVAAEASWACEAAAILAWSLGKFGPTAYDVPVDPDLVWKSLGFTEKRLISTDIRPAARIIGEATLRPESEIDRFASDVTLIQWRLRTFNMDPADTAKAGFDPRRMDFEAYLRKHPNFNPAWLKSLILQNGDLVIAGNPIADSSDDDRDLCKCVNLPRHRAAYWLQGDHPVFSKVDPSTILSAIR